MTDDKIIPEGLVDGEAMPASRGFVEDGWFFEEDSGATRLGIRIHRKLHEETTPYQTIHVYETGFFGRMLTLDDIMMFTERDEFVYHEMLVHVPLCSIPEPRQVLIIGGGDCGCLREALKHPSVERVVQCDIDERVTAVSREFFPWVEKAAADPRAELLFEDGVAYIERNRDTFDLVIIDSTDPKGPAVGLFLSEFYQKVGAALKPGGVMVAQTESPHWGAAAVGAIYGQLRGAFAHVSTFLGYIPTYPSGSWSWAYAGKDHRHDAFFDEARVAALEPSCLYYNREVHRAAFALPTFVRRTTEGDNPFATFDQRHRELVGQDG